MAYYCDSTRQQGTGAGRRSGVFPQGRRKVTGYTAQKITPEFRQRSRPVSPDKGRRGPLQNTRLFCSAVSGLRCQVVAPIAFCSHDYERAFPESNPVRLLAEMSRPATERDDGARQGKLVREMTCVPSRFSD